MRVARKIAYNVAASTVCEISSTVLALISIGIITRYLGQKGFGDYATVLAFFAFFAALSDLGLYSISTREISRQGADEEKIMGNMFAFRITSSVLVLALSPLVVYFFPYSPELKAGIIISAAAYVFSCAYQILNGVFQKNLAMDKVAFSETLGKALQVMLVIVAVKYDLGFTWIIWALFFYMVFSFSLVFLWSRKYIKIVPQFDFTYWKRFLKESYPVGIAAIITFLYFKMDTILLSVMRSSEDVGIYNAAYKVIENITFFPGMIMGLIFPIMSHSIFADRERFLDISNKTFKVFLLIIVPLVVGTLFLSSDVINLIGGAGFAESSVVLSVLVFSLALIFFSSFYNSMLLAGNLQKKLMYVLAVAAIFNLSANYLVAIPYFSYLGASVVSVATQLIVAGTTFYLALRYLKYKPEIENIWAIIFSGVLMALILYFLQGQNFFISGFLSVSSYSFFLWLFRAVKTEEITSIISRKGIEEYDGQQIS
ncbi:MAG TPA: flippase [Patescibacteria group bacterium]|nr:flippase [Patescibacteria group bacterium]